MFKLASWNVNSLNVRLPQVLSWIKHANIDVLALQETKLVDDRFPWQIFKDEGYHAVFSGQKTYNGVAILSRWPIQDVVMDVPEMDDPERRILAATIGGIRLINLYVPNGREVDSEKYYYKLSWLKQVTRYIKGQLLLFSKLAVVGDFNIAPEDKDVHSPKEWHGNVLVSDLEREAYFKLLDLGLNDSFRVLYPEKQIYSWWDYRAASFRRNRGLRIDHILLNDNLQVRCLDSNIDATLRQLERPSDHAPIWVTLDV